MIKGPLNIEYEQVVDPTIGFGLQVSLLETALTLFSIWNLPTVFSLFEAWFLLKNVTQTLG